MARSITLALASLLQLLVLTQVASAHYLWVTVNAKVKPHGETNVYFEESPAPGDGHYLDPFVKAGKTWIRTIESPEPQPLTMKEVKPKEKQRWLQAKLPHGGQRSIDSYGKFGVYRYGKTDVLLHYYARLLDVNSHEALHELGRAEQMQLDIVPHTEKDHVDLKVLWRGKPAADRMVFIRGPKGFRKNVKTDKQGNVRFSLSGAGQYRFRTSVEVMKPGKDDGKDYAFVRHNGTLIMKLPLER